MPDILLTTLNAKYAHASFGLRYLLANLGSLASRAKILEFEISHRSVDVVEAILNENPRIVGIGVYIWNVLPATQVVADLKRLRPDIFVVLGGPEVSHETDQQGICGLADYVITGEADLAFAQLCDKLLTGRRPLSRVIPAELPSFSELKLPYDFYDQIDLAHRVVYVEASRGCPFSCEFCLSSLDVPVRNVPLGPFLGAMASLLDRGLRRFKFVDRTFNLNLAFSRAILDLFWNRYQPGLFLHFEMIPDRLPEGLRELIRRFPPGALQFEVGIQSFNPEVCERISRRQNVAQAEQNLQFLRGETGVHTHVDLIVGLPGEDVDSFAAGFDRLVALAPQEIQVGLLKRLRGTPIARHDEAFKMAYSPHAPYEILQTGAIDFSMMQRLRRFARYWDLVANSGNFIQTAPRIWLNGSPFARFLHFSDWIFSRAGRNHGIALRRLMELLFEYLTQELKQEPRAVAIDAWNDYQRGGRSDRPDFLLKHLSAHIMKPQRTQSYSKAVKRQMKHLTP